ncbi:MAG: 4Fe-4S binding protein [Planctomycetaceae bacterium]|jgi:ferredoxin|nr:4Fe-4S binding protein [Planctomycetaceae bacterium]
MTAIVDKTQCIGCGECVSNCPLDAIALKDDQEGKAFVDPDTCGECGECINACPLEAISL